MVTDKIIVTKGDGVIGKKMPPDSALRNMKKTELIELLHIAQHNYEVLLEYYRNAVSYNKRLLEAEQPKKPECCITLGTGRIYKGQPGEKMELLGDLDATKEAREALRKLEEACKQAVLHNPALSYDAMKEAVEALCRQGGKR